jgi:hypothetical protein
MRGQGRLCLAHGVGQGLRDGLRDSPAMSMSHEPRRLTLQFPGQASLLSWSPPDPMKLVSSTYFQHRLSFH